MRGVYHESGASRSLFFEPGAQKRTVLIHHCYEGYNEIKEERIVEIRDTIVKPTYNKIKD